MVAGKVKAAIGLQKSPATPKQEPSPTPPKHFCSPSSQKPVFSRSFGVYFPRSSAQVQPRPSDCCVCGKRDVSKLLRLVDELQARESRLQTENLECKLLKETASIVPFLEKEIYTKNSEIESSLQRIEKLESENEILRKQVAEIGEEKVKLGNEIEELRRVNAELVQERSRAESTRPSSSSYEIDDCCSSQRFQGLIDASARSNLLKNLKKVKQSERPDLKVEDVAIEQTQVQQQQQEQAHNSGESTDSVTSTAANKTREPRVPKPPPPPKRSFSTSSSVSSCSGTTVEKGISSLDRTRPAPPPQPPVKAAFSAGAAARVPPPPPPPPPKKGANGVAAVKRMPEVVEFYHSLMRRDSKRESGAGVSDIPAASNARDMIGEIENRSTHLLAIKTDVEIQGDFIRFLIKEVHNAAFTDIEDVVAFVKWLDDELSFLVDERAVLKHFDWPEHKADAMREAAFGYCDLKKLESEASSLCNDLRQPCGSALKKMQASLDKLEHGVYNLSRMREAATKRYKGFQIPWEWMLDTGVVSQIKLASVKLAKRYMKRVAAELEAGGGPDEEELMLQGVRFAFRVHQFAGGFDVETMRAFQELRNKARSCHIECQTQQQQKLYCRPTSC